jgi:uncharacterized membrane protein (DUF2068 family)
MQTRNGLRVVAAFEAAKGLLVLAAGFGLLSVLHKDVATVAEELVRHLHLNAASRTPRIFLDAMERLSDVRLWVLAVLAFAYATLRLIEAYGLWRRRRWAEWVAVASGGIYLPFEIYELARGPSWLKASTFAANVVIVLYMTYALRESRTASVKRAR